jgi:hypothetical protein
MYGFIHNVGCRLANRRYEDRHYEQVMKWILYRELVSTANNRLKFIFNFLFRNAELWSVNLDELPVSYVPPEKDRTWGLGWFKS